MLTNTNVFEPNLQIPVSVIIPMRNEEGYLQELFTSLSNQKYDKQLLEIIFLDGMSTDRSRQMILDFSSQEDFETIKIIENEGKTIPRALNLGIRAARHEVIIRLDCHAIYHPEYLAFSVHSLLTLKQAVAVGGVIDPIGKTKTGTCIAAAIRSRLGNGGAGYRNLNTIEETETIWCGCWRKNDIISAGGYDETLEANEDFELNQRLRKLGKIYTNPKIQAQQYVRESLTTLAKQYFRYGYWKWVVTKKDKSNFQTRQAIPILFFSFFVMSIALMPITPLLPLILLGPYAFALSITPKASGVDGFSQQIITSMSLAVMHLSWYTGFMYSIANTRTSSKSRN